MNKNALVMGAIALSFIPIWRDIQTNQGLNLWVYIYSTAFTPRKHITPEVAIENYRRNNG